jgi:hypothetical protein
MSTSVGYSSSSLLDVMAATMMIGLWRFAMSFCKTRAGRVFRISAPIVGSNATR